MEILTRRLRGSGLGDADTAGIVLFAKQGRMMPAGTFIRRRGGHSNFNHFILEGWAARCDEVPFGNRQITNFLLPGDFCDLHSEAVGTIDHDVVALTPVVVATIPVQNLITLEADRPAVARAMWRFSLTESSIFRAWITNVGQRETEARVAHLLCELHVRLRLAGLVGDHTFQMPLTQESMSEATGMTSVHMNRVIQRLRSMKLIHLEHRVLTILDIERLQVLAGFEADYLHLRAS